MSESAKEDGAVCPRCGRALEADERECACGQPINADDPSSEELDGIAGDEELDEEVVEETDEDHHDRLFEQLPPGPQEEISFPDEEPAVAVATDEESEAAETGFSLSPKIIILLALNLILFVGILYLAIPMLRGCRGRTTEEVSSGPSPPRTLAPDAPRITEGGTVAREVENAILAAGLECRVAAIEIELPGPVAVVTLRKDAAWDKPSLRRYAEADTEKILRAIFTAFPKISAVRVEVLSRLGSELGPKETGILRVSAAREQYNALIGKRLKPAALLAALNATYSPELLER